MWAEGLHTMECGLAYKLDRVSGTVDGLAAIKSSSSTLCCRQCAERYRGLVL
jgi:hypothetical protein